MKRSMIGILAIASLVGFAPAVELQDLQQDVAKSQQKLTEFREAELQNFNCLSTSAHFF